ncbi:hypothetical protein JXI42_03085 [bacterium]|nr:hypothetical protein [bacterium]
MVNSDLKNIFKKAAKIASEVPDSMQPAAFNRALDILLEEEYYINIKMGKGTTQKLKKNIPYEDKVLLLLYSQYPNSVLDFSLFEWTRHRHLSYFRRDVLRALQKNNLIEYDEETNQVRLSREGLRKVEDIKV